MKTIKMLNVKEDIKITISINENIISIKDDKGNNLYFKIIELDNTDEINNIATTLLNNHFEKGYVISSIDVF